MRAVILLALAGCANSAAPDIQLTAPVTPEASSQLPTETDPFETNTQYWAADTVIPYLDGLLKAQPRYREDGTHRLFHRIPDLKLLTFKVVQGQWVEFVMNDLDDVSRKGQRSRVWGTSTAARRLVWQDILMTGHATNGTDQDLTAGRTSLLWWASDATLIQRIVPLNPQTEEVTEIWSQGKRVSAQTQPRKPRRRNFLDGNVY